MKNSKEHSDKEKKEEKKYPRIEKASSYVVSLLKSDLPKSVIYHNFLHTQRSLKRVEEIIASEELSQKDHELVQLALLFANTGFISKEKNVGEKSAEIAKSYLQEHNFDSKEIDKILRLIRAAHLIEIPTSLLENMAADAYHFGVSHKNYDEFSALKRREQQLRTKKPITDDEWLQQEFNYFTEEHQFYSDYALKNWEKRKQKNLTKLIKVKKKDKANDKKEKRKAYYKEKFKSESPERGIQTLYRVALRNHLKLSDIADTKANILLSVNAIIISLVLANLISKLNDPNNRFLIIPTIVFVIFSIITMIMSVKATQPNVTRGEFSREDVEQKKVNLIFFGNFHHMKLSRYKETLRDLLENKEDVYDMLTMDLYYLGVVLDQKYKLLRYTYITFLTGMILSVLAFALAFIYRDTFTL